ncbi:MAG: proton-conducting transporter transmembrane domain-containing protein, partial [Pseudonocardia sp.]
FLVAGLVERQGGSTSVNRLGGLATASPFLAILYFVPAMNLAGIPPFSGFIGKLGLLQAGVADGSPLALTLVAGGVVTSLLTLLAVARVWTRAFWRPASQEPLADTAAAAASDAGTDAGEPGGAGPETGPPSGRKAAWSAAWERHEQVATAGTAVDAPRATEDGALRPLPGLMVGATAAMVAVTVSLTGIAGALYGYTDRAARDLLDRTPYIEAVFDGPVPAEEGE